MTLQVRLEPLNDGPARAVVLGHGLTLDRQSLERLAEALGSLGHPVLIWELPGHGDVEPACVGWSVDALGLALAKAVSTASLRDPLLVGVSLAGYASILAAALVRPGGLVVIGCGGGPQPPADPGRVSALAAWATGQPLERTTAIAMATAELGAGHDEVDSLVEDWSSDRSAGARFLPGYLAMFTRSDLAAAAASIRDNGTPCRVVRGRGDPWVSGADASLLSEMLACPLLEVIDAAHQPQWTHTAQVVSCMETLNVRSVGDLEATS